ncbi:MAG TPA: 50S ribosomal protein L23 [Gammaproteobacteria bacterium]|nr:50S ribosomal protein L23 [Gammaproteobacteria bacterium]
MNQERLLKVIIAPHISEKAANMREKNNQYAFRVLRDATKTEIKDAIEFLFNKKVESVCVVNAKPRQKVFKGIKSRKKEWKKAYVTLSADQTLDMIGVQ